MIPTAAILRLLDQGVTQPADAGGPRSADAPP